MGLSDHFDQPVEIIGFEQMGPAEAQWSLRVGARGARVPAA